MRLKLKLGKKGFEMGMVLPIVIILLATVIAIGLGSQVLEEIQTTQDDDQATHANVTLTWGGNNTAMSLLESRIIESSILLYNNGTLVNKGANYTTSPSTITILNASPSGKVGSQSEWVTNALNVSYDYNIGSAARNATGQGLTTQNTFAKWMPTIALVVVISVVIGILIIYLMGKLGGVGKYV